MQSIFHNLKSANFRHTWLLVFLAFFIPVSQNILPVFIVLILLNWIFLKKEIKKDNWKASIFIVSFYALHVLGLLWSENLDFGWFDVQIKLSLLILPVVFCFSIPLIIKDFERTLTAYVIGCCSAVIIGVSHSVYSYYTNDTNYIDLYNEGVSPSLHIGYFAMYMNFAIIILIYKLDIRSNVLYTPLNLLRISFILFFAVAVFLSTSRNGLIVLFLILILAIIYAVIRYRKWLFFITSAVIAWVVLSSVLKDYNSKASSFHGFDEITETLKKEKIEKKSLSSSEVRILVWKMSINIVKDHPLLGVGTGDIKDELIKLYKKEGYPILVKRQYNSHNQYLQTAAALGIPTLIVLLLMFISPLLVRWRRLHFLAVFLSIIVGVACLTESVLEVQAGVIFYTFFASLFAQNMRSDYGTNFIDNPLIIKRKQLKE